MEMIERFKCISRPLLQTKDHIIYCSFTIIFEDMRMKVLFVFPITIYARYHLTYVIPLQIHILVATALHIVLFFLHFR